MKQSKNKQIYLSRYTDILEKNMKILQWYEYVYTGSIVLFLRIADWKKLPDDVDVAINRNNKTVKDLEILYKQLSKNKDVQHIQLKTVYRKKYNINKMTYELQKYQAIDLKNTPHKLLEILLESGNIRLSYNIDNMTIEIFPEKNGNGLTNLGVMDKTIIYHTLKTTDKSVITVPLLSYTSIAQGYTMNFLKEIVWNNIYRFTDMHSKPKDWIRLFTIIYLLGKEWKDASPKGVLKFIKQTVAEYKKLPKARRSLYIETAIKEFPWINNMLKDIIKEYSGLSKERTSKKVSFLDFYGELAEYKRELKSYTYYLQKDILSLLKKEVMGEKYCITDAVSNFSHTGEHCEKKEIKQIAKNLNKITKQIDIIWIKNKNESFAYFYEMYMLKHLFIKPIANII